MEPNLKEASPDGGLYIYHALAFSTLLSSQETDALRSPNFRSSLAATLLIYPGFPPCQIGPSSKYSNRLPDLAFRISPSHQHTACLEWCLRTRSSAEACLRVAPRVRARLAAFPPPRGKRNLTGPRHPRQIVPEILTSPAPGSSKPLPTAGTLPLFPPAERAGQANVSRSAT